MDRDDLAFRATAVAELHAFFSPYFIWRSIWEEVVPREKLDPSLTWDREPGDSDVYQDRFGITTGRYGLIRQLGLWYICGEMYQGYYPPMSLILNMIAHRVGADRPQRGRRARDPDRTYRDEVGDTARTTARDAMVPIVPKPDDPGRGFGWFRARTYREVTGRPSDNPSKTYITCSEDFVLANVFAIVNTAFTVARIVQSDESGGAVPGERVQELCERSREPCGQARDGQGGVRIAQPPRGRVLRDGPDTAHPARAPCQRFRRRR